MDIETVPRKGLDDMVEAEVAKRTERRLEQSGGDPAEAKSLIRSTSLFSGKWFVSACVGSKVMGHIGIMSSASLMNTIPWKDSLMW